MERGAKWHETAAEGDARHLLHCAPMVAGRRGGAGVRVRTDDVESEARSVSVRAPSRRALLAMDAHRVASLAWWWHLFAAAVIVAALIGVAYQTHPSYSIAIGNRVQDD